MTYSDGDRKVFGKHRELSARVVVLSLLCLVGIIIAKKLFHARETGIRNMSQTSTAQVLKMNRFLTRRTLHCLATSH